MVSGWLGGRINPKQDYSGCKFQTYRGPILVYSMLCEPTSSDNEEKEVDNIISNRLVNLKRLQQT